MSGVRYLGRDDEVGIRHPVPGDEGPFLEGVKDARAWHHPWVSPPDTPVLFRSWLANANTERNQRFLVCRPAAAARGEVLVGVYNLSQIIRLAFECGFLGYYALGSEGAGYMSRGLRLVLDHAFGPLGLHRLEANIQPENHRSIELVKRCGFELEGFSPNYLRIGGRWCDHERWAIRSEQWTAPDGRAGGPDR